MKKYFSSQWVMYLIGLISIVSIKVIFKHLNSDSDKWAPLQAVVTKSSVNLIKDTVERREWCKCVMDTYKKKYPNGLDKLSQDSFNTQATTISYDCIHAIRNK
jgi:hypothetical protein